MTYCKIAHSHPHNVKYADNDIVNFVQKLDEEGHLNNSIVFIFGDHGSRWGPHRKYIQGYHGNDNF
jgi:phosphoglycerol transferase MdoB-like AlkP superfamily enzyme